MCIDVQVKLYKVHTVVMVTVTEGRIQPHDLNTTKKNDWDPDMRE